ncbi:MAG TPA: GAF domain-containing sensor histidine kinase, partial [Bacillales bacterium]|nr:GAF domain-containing sensor histidine kinase [Bacillales bacterium]
ALFSFTYVVIMFVLGSQNRGIIDAFSYLFFYSPLVGVSVIAAVITRLQKERNRLKTLFTLTTELNRLLFSKTWRKNIEELFKSFIGVEATAFWVKSGDDWLLTYLQGSASKIGTLSTNEESEFNRIYETKVYGNRKRECIPADSCFPHNLRAFVFAPLTVENQTVGMLVVGRNRSHSFTSEEVRSIATFANQMAVLLKNYQLLSEQKKRLLLEERNRIAREIHDGVAQSVAGAVMKLETAHRLFPADPNKAATLTENSINKLRTSLKEIRQSIYALKPHPMEANGMRKAIKEKIMEMEKDGGPKISFHETGEVFRLTDEVERVIYETIREALQNCVKHARARHVKIRLAFREDQIKLVIKDDGVGFSLVEAMVKAREEPHFGILSMNEQADQIGASLHINSAEGKGTTIQLLIHNETGEEYENDSTDAG